MLFYIKTTKDIKITCLSILKLLYFFHVNAIKHIFMCGQLQYSTIYLLYLCVFIFFTNKIINKFYMETIFNFKWNKTKIISKKKKLKLFNT